MVYPVVSACPFGGPGPLQLGLSWRLQRDAAVDPDYDRVAAGDPPSLQEVLPKIATIGEFPPFFLPIE